MTRDVTKSEDRDVDPVEEAYPEGSVAAGDAAQLQGETDLDGGSGDAAPPPVEVDERDGGGRDGGGGRHGGGGGGDGRDGFGARLARMEAMGREQLRLMEQVIRLAKEAERLSTAAVGRMEGLGQMLLEHGVPAKYAGLGEAQAAAATEADEEFERVTEMKLDEHGRLIALDPAAVLSADRRVHRTTAEFFDAFRAGFDQPPIDLALDHAWRWMLFTWFVSSEQEAITPLKLEELHCLHEILRAAELRVSAEREEVPFSLLVRWIELYARDAVVKASQKSPANMLVRLEYYVQASYPADPWSPARAVSEWRTCVGIPTSPAAKNDEPGEPSRG